jgi:hypothetical protein
MLAFFLSAIVGVGDESIGGADYFAISLRMPQVSVEICVTARAARTRKAAARRERQGMQPGGMTWNPGIRRAREPAMRCAAFGLRLCLL